MRELSLFFDHTSKVESTMPIKVMTTLLALLATSLAMADPSPEVRWLMNDKLSMLDFGLIRMQAALQQELPLVYKYGALNSINVADAYNPDNNNIKLTISALYAPNGTSDDKDPTTACIHLIEAVKKQLADRPTVGAESSSWVEFFHHAGWTNDKKEDDELAKALPWLLRITVNVQASSEPAKCTSMYMDKNIQVVK
jgi:hypothetical protein